MKNIPKWFEKHFWMHLIQKDFMPDWHSSSKACLRIAWRAYKRGKKDGLNLAEENYYEATRMDHDVNP